MVKIRCWQIDKDIHMCYNLSWVWRGKEINSHFSFAHTKDKCIINFITIVIHSLIIKRLQWKKCIKQMARWMSIEYCTFFLSFALQFRTIASMYKYLNEKNVGMPEKVIKRFIIDKTKDSNCRFVMLKANNEKFLITEAKIYVNRRIKTKDFSFANDAHADPFVVFLLFSLTNAFSWCRRTE